MVVIKCDKCGTVYDLDENMIPVQGAPVQCTKCHNVFMAYRPGMGPSPKPVPAPAPAPPPPAVAAPPPRPPPGRPTAPAPVRAPPPESSTVAETPVFKAPSIPAMPPAAAGPPYAPPSPDELGTLPSLGKLTFPLPGQAPAPAAPAPVPTPAPAAPGEEFSELATMAVVPAGMGTKPAPAPAPAPADDGGPPEAEEEEPAPPPRRPTPAPRGKGAPAARSPSAAKTAPAAKTMMLGPVEGEPDEYEMVMAKSHRNRNIVLGAVGTVVVILAGAFLWPTVKRAISGGANAAAQRKAREAHALLLLDDESSLQRAAEVYAEAIGADPKWAPLKAERALPLALLAASVKGQLDEIKVRDGEIENRIVALQQRFGDGWAKEPEGDRLREEKKKLAASQAPLLARFEPLKKESGALMKEANEKAHDHPDVVRARGLMSAIDGDADRALKALDYLRKTEGDDPLALYARGAMYAAGDPGKEKRERAVEALRAALAADKKLVRARYDLARSLADLGQKDAALQELEGLLQDNPAHERAKALKARLAAPPPRPPAPPPEQPAEPPAEQPK
jgi:predicted Zn finger-like uncharacterized protein